MELCSTEERERIELREKKETMKRYLIEERNE